VRVPEVVNVCVPVMVNHGVPVGACVRACVRTTGNRAVDAGMLSTDHSCCLCNGYQPDHWLWAGLVGFEAVSSALLGQGFTS
jgi:hypothetical protein